MCRIDFTIQYEDIDTNLILDWEGQYRLQGVTEWIPFEFDFTNPKTPEINELGVYQMRIRLFDGRVWGDYYYTSFSIGCGAFTTGFSIGFDA